MAEEPRRIRGDGREPRGQGQEVEVKEGPRRAIRREKEEEQGREVRPSNDRSRSRSEGRKAPVLFVWMMDKNKDGIMWKADPTVQESLIDEREVPPAARMTK